MFTHLILRNDFYAARRLAPRKVNLRGAKRSDLKECFAETVSWRHGTGIEQTDKKSKQLNMRNLQFTSIVNSSNESIPFQAYDSVGKTALHRVVINLDHKSLTATLAKMSAEAGLKSLRIQDKYGNTAAHYAAMLGRRDFMTIIINKIAIGKRIALCSVKNLVGETILHCAAFYGSAEVTRCILENLNESERCRLAIKVNKRNTTALAGARAQGRLDTVEVLERMLRGDHAATIDSDPNLVQPTPRPASLPIVSTQGAIQYEDRYTIHDPINGVKIYALTLYNTHRRHGAEQEATAIDEALQKIPCSCWKEQWGTQAQFENLLASRLEGIRRAADCGLLMLFVMSHGSQGALHDEDGRRIRIDSILHQVKHHLENETPVAIVVQACQLSTNATIQQPKGEGQHDAAVALAQQRGDEYVKHLRQNTLLIMPLPGEAALRGVYMPAMASQLSQADGETSLIEMHKAACRLTNKFMALHDTCQKKIVLPPMDPSQNHT